MRDLYTAGIQLSLCLHSAVKYRTAPNDTKKRRRIFLIISFILLILHFLSAFASSWSIGDALINGSGWFDDYISIPSFTGLGDISGYLTNFVGDGLLVSVHSCFRMSGP